jgi:hypothetical protein
LVTHLQLHFEEHLQEFGELVKRRIQLKDRRLWLCINGGKTFFNAAKPISKIAKGDVDPAHLVGDKHQPDQSKHCLLVRENAKIFDHSAILFRGKSGLGKVLVEFQNGGQGSMHVLGMLEDR